MVVLVKPSPQLGSKAMDGNQHKVEANVLLLGAENVGKSGEHKTELDFEYREFCHVYMVYLLSLQIIIYLFVCSPHCAISHQKVHRRIWGYRYVK